MKEISNDKCPLCGAIIKEKISIFDRVESYMKMAYSEDGYWPPIEEVAEYVEFASVRHILNRLIESGRIGWSIKHPDYLAASEIDIVRFLRTQPECQWFSLREVSIGADVDVPTVRTAIRRLRNKEWVQTKQNKNGHFAILVKLRKAKYGEA